jgi:hypothetical protein
MHLQNPKIVLVHNHFPSKQFPHHPNIVKFIPIIVPIAMMSSRSQNPLKFSSPSSIGPYTKHYSLSISIREVRRSGNTKFSTWPIFTILGHSSLTRTTNRPLIQKPHNTTPANWANIHDTYSPVLRFWSRNLASHLKKLPSCYLDSPHFFPLHTSKKLREEQVDQRPAPSKLWRMQAKIHNVQTTSKTERKQKRELCCFAPRLMVTNRLFSLGTFCQSKSAQSSNHQVVLVHTAKIRTQVLITDHSANMWSVQRKNDGPLWKCKSLPRNIRWPPLSGGSPMVLRCPPSTLLNPTKVIHYLDFTFVSCQNVICLTNKSWVEFITRLTWMGLIRVGEFSSERNRILKTTTRKRRAHKKISKLSL